MKDRKNSFFAYELLTRCHSKALAAYSLLILQISFLYLVRSSSKNRKDLPAVHLHVKNIVFVLQSCPLKKNILEII